MTDWTETLLADCKRLYIDEGKSAAETARILGQGVTRNSVVGQAHRRGWMKAHRKAPSQPKPKPVRKPVLKPEPAVTEAPVSEKELARLLKQQEAAVRETEALALRSANDNSIPLVGRRFGQCAWPVEEPAKPEFQLCCGKAVMAGARKPYCKGHMSLAVDRVLSAKELVRSLRRYTA